MSTISLVESIDQVLQKYSVFTLVKALLISAACFFIYRTLIRLLKKNCSIQTWRIPIRG